MSGATAATATTAAVGTAGMTAAEAGFLASATAASGVAAGAGTSAFSLSSLATAASLASAGVGAIGAIGQSRANSAAAGYNAEVAANNAKLQTETANREMAVGEQRTGIQGEKNKAALAATLANQGASGVDVNTGSSVDVRASQAKLGMLDMQTIRSDAAWKAYGGQINALSDKADSQFLRTQQKYDTTSGYLNAGTTVLGGVGQAAMYNKWLSASSPIPSSVTTGPGAVTEGLGGLY